jgi:carboxypeptidase family protein
MQSSTRGVLLLAGLAPAVLSAQTVRGTVTDRSSGAAGAGAVVILLRDITDSTVGERSVLADGSGVFSIVAWGPGTYRLAVRRIGRVPFLSEPLVLKEGEVRVVDVPMDPIAVRGLGVAVLGPVNIKRATPCQANTSDGERIATLWDDARTALMASEISARDRLVSRRLVRYMREIDMPSMTVVNERLKAFDAHDIPGDPQFRSLSADSLSVLGYWRVRAGMQIEFYGLDASALLSEAFVRDHCFRLEDNPQENHGLVGLRFEPVKSRTKRDSPAEVEGTIWIDALSSALQSLDFSWTKLRGDLKNVGGEVIFARVDSGPWFVSSWRLRMPREIEISGKFGTTGRPGLVEEGGLVLEGEIDTTRVSATINGEVRDGNRRPLEGAVIRIVGTDLRAVTGPDGRYTLRGVPPGLQFVVADHASLTDLGVRAGEGQVLLDDGVRREVSFSAPTQGEIVAVLCEGQETPRNRATVRVALVDSMTERPLGGVRVRLASRDPTQRGAFEMIDETDASGSVVFCGVPADQPLVVTEPGADGIGARTLLEVTPRRGSAIGRVIRLKAG